MISVMMGYGGEVIFLRINGHSVHFGNATYGNYLATIEGLKLDREGVMKEFPELDGNEHWREEAIKRFKLKIKSLANENAVADYLIKDLQKFGYTPSMIMSTGTRWRKL